MAIYSSNENIVVALYLHHAYPLGVTHDLEMAFATALMAVCITRWAVFTPMGSCSPAPSAGQLS